jgi:hypothetical protein
MTVHRRTPATGALYRARDPATDAGRFSDYSKRVSDRTETAGVPEQEVLLSRPVILLTLVAFAALSGFQLLLSVVPLYADEAGGGSSGAGLATACSCSRRC